MPRILLQFICAIAFYLLANLGQVKAQPYQNEWIKYGLTYFKFKISQDGLYRIDQPTLARLGLSQVPVAQFSLWRNGIEIPLYTSTQTGLLSTDGYLEFWGESNDGVADQVLYNSPTTN